MGRKRRFGVSVSEGVAEALDRLAEVLNADRSSLVEDAIRVFIDDHLHYLVPHRCGGVMMISGRVERGRLFKAIENNRDVVRSYTHTHVGGLCLETLIVEGPSSKIVKLHKELLEIPGCRVRYMPITCIAELLGKGFKRPRNLT
ncbi:MAG: CopG family transcriptional regulator [Desulfurococcales archaeon ex4484_204]|nr:MAG: CopG family transcriptional regulator [Desulfurococcales archaeon ex4484_204]